MATDPKCFAALWEIDPGERVRVAIGEKQGSFHCVVWAEFGKDGSVYFGPRNPKYAYVKAGAKEVQKGEFFVGYEEGTPLQDAPIKNANRISFHGSGHINTFGRRSIRSSIRELTERQLLCHFLPESLENFPLLDVHRKRDISLVFPIAYSRAIVCSVYVSPLNQALPPIEVKDAHFQCSVLIECSSIPDVQPLCIQLLFSQKPGDVWPPYTYIVWPVIDHDLDKLASNPSLNMDASPNGASLDN